MKWTRRRGGGTGDAAYRPYLLSRLGLWLRARSITLAPEEIGLAEGLRAAVATATVLAAAGALGLPILSWAAFAAFWTCLADPGGPNRTRFHAMASFALCGTMLAGISAYAAGIGLAVAAPLVLCAVFLCGFARAYGSVATQVGVLAALACVVAADFPMAAPDAARLALVFQGGSLWAMLLSLLWPVYPYMPARRAVTALYRALGDMTADLVDLETRQARGDVRSRLATDHRRAVRETLEQARATMGRLAGRRGGIRWDGDKLFVALEAANRVFAELIALAELLDNDALAPDEARMRRRALRQLAALLYRSMRLLRQINPDLSPLTKPADQLARLARRLSGPIAGPLLASAEQLKGMSDAAPSPMPPAQRRDKPASRLLDPIRANLTWTSLILRHALRCAVAVTVGYVIIRLLQLPYGYWATLAIIVIMQPYVATTWPRALESVVGSVLGGGLAALLGLVLHSPFALVAAVFPLTAATIAMRAVNYSLFAFFLTPTFLLVADLIHPEINELSLAAYRALDTVLGGAIALASCYVLWPSWEPGRLRQHLADAIEANGRYVALAAQYAGSDERAVDDARRQAGLASNNAEASRQRMALEGLRRREALEAATTILALLRRLSGTATVLWLHPQRPASAGAAEFPQWCEMTTSRLANAVRGAATVEPWPDLDRQRLDDAHQKIVQQFALLDGATQRFIAARRG